MKPAVEVRRVYDDPTAGKGEYRALVDRLWPRGVSKTSLQLDEWAKDVAPSSDLRTWYGHDPERFDEFARRYREELRRQPAAGAARTLIDAAGDRHTLVLLTATKDLEHSGAVVLAGHLRSSLSRKR